jgi:phosphohistidine phosphatase
MNEARQLLLLRHADAVNAANLDDIDRPLSQKGHRQAAFLASHLKSIPIDYVLCSSSARTRETAIPILHTRCNSMPTVVYDKHVYGADARGLLQIISELPPAAKTVLLVGHNPAMEDLLEILQLSGRGAIPGGFKKGACVHLATNAPWKSLASQATRVAGYYRGEAEPSAAFAC